MAEANQDEEGCLPVSRVRRSSIIATFGELDALSGIETLSSQDMDHSLQTSYERQRVSTTNQSLDGDPHLSEKAVAHHLEKIGDENPPLEKTVLYLAYGSNLYSETFLGRRGIKPLSRINVVVPDLQLTFDIPGVPYTEPCFAATKFRNPAGGKDNADKVEDSGWNGQAASECSRLIPGETSGYTSNIPLVGVVYEVTLADYAWIIATEGGGRGYKDRVVDCYPFPESYNSADPIPERPNTNPFKAHTLLSPFEESSTGTSITTSIPCFSPPVRLNAQPSVRYLNLIEMGAAEHDLPIAYRTHLSMIQPYKITSLRQRIGKVVFLGFWGPSLLLVLRLSRSLAGTDGRSPGWLMSFGDFVFSGMWQSYDKIFSRIFSDGERTVDHDST